MIFLKINNETNLVEFTHFMPFDEKHGLKKTKEELEQEGILVEALPEKPEKIENKGIKLYANPLRWEYFDLTPKEQSFEFLRKLVFEGKITEEEAKIIARESL